LITEIERKAVWPGKVTPRGILHVLKLAKVYEPTHVKTGIPFAPFFAGGLVENLGPESEQVRDLSLGFQAKKPIILVPFTRINPVTPSAVRRPRPPALLQPDGKKNLSLSVPQPSVCIPGGNFYQRENPNLRHGGVVRP
jgi:hypothetical protein